MRDESHCQPRSGKISRTATLLALSVTLVFLTSRGAQAAKAEEDTEKERPALARSSSWVLFSGRAVKGAPFLAYGYLSEIEALPRTTPQPADNESSALLSFVTEGTVVDIQQNPPALFITSRGTLRFFFDPQANRDFAEPESFPAGRKLRRMR